jgi:hypothetical protein
VVDVYVLEEVYPPNVVDYIHFPYLQDIESSRGNSVFLPAG